MRVRRCRGTACCSSIACCGIGLVCRLLVQLRGRVGHVLVVHGVLCHAAVRRGRRSGWTSIVTEVRAVQASAPAGGRSAGNGKNSVALNGNLNPRGGWHGAYHAPARARLAEALVQLSPSRGIKGTGACLG